MKYDIIINRPYEPVSCYTQRQADEVAEELRKVGIRVLTLQNAWRRKYACSFHSLKESNELYFEPKAMDVFCFLCELKDVNFQTIFGSGFQCIKYAAVSELNTNYRYKILIIKMFIYASYLLYLSFTSRTETWASEAMSLSDDFPH